MDKKQDSMPDEDNRYESLIVGVLVFTFIVTIGLVTAVVVVSLRQSDKPRAAILIHPRGEVVVLGETREDLDQAMKAAKEWAGSFVRSAIRGDVSQATEGVDQKNSLLASGRIRRISGPVRCILLKSDRTMCMVKIAEGRYNGQVYWAPKACVAR